MTRHRRSKPCPTRELEITLANSAAFWVLAVLVLAAAYLLPTIIGTIRGVDQLALVFVVSLIGAPAGIGWLAALILAFGPRRLPPQPPPARPPLSW
jgi:hypothetical protein